MAKLVHEKNGLLTRKEERKAHKYIKRWDKLFWLKMWRNRLIESVVNIEKRRYRMMHKASRQIAIARRMNTDND